jgi:hypothetical protein
MFLLSFLEMLTAIKFYRESDRGTIEIKEVGSDTVLAKETQVMDLLVPEMFPQMSLRIRLTGSKATATVHPGRVVVLKRHAGSITPPNLPLH